MTQKIQTLDEMMEDYDKERIAEIDRWEQNKPEWIKAKVEAERKREIELGIRDEDGNFITPDESDDIEEEEDEDNEDE